MNRSVAVAPVVLAVLFALTGCGGDADPDPSGSSSGTRTPSPTPTASATPTPTPTASGDAAPPPPPPPASTALTGHGAYDRCITMVNGYLYPGQSVVPAGYGAADVIARTDGKWYIYVEVTVTAAPTPEQRDVAYECILGGTVENPVDDYYGAVIRSPLSERNPEMSLEGDD